MGMDPNSGKLHRISEAQADERQRLVFSIGENVTVKGGNFRVSAIDHDGIHLKGLPLEQKIGRNEPCPCGSGKKYKRCCALLGQSEAVG